MVGGGSDPRSFFSVIDQSRKALEEMGTALVAAIATTPLKYPRFKTLDFVIQPQIALNWCWAAVAASIARFYSPDTAWTQCRIACEHLERNDCCTANPPGDIPAACNVPAHLSHVMPYVCYCKRVAYAVSLKDCQRQIAEGFPVGAHITWPGQSVDYGHFVVISGYDLDLGILVIDDPSGAQGQSDVPYAKFLDDYLEAGATWDRTYYTKP
jgi:hypothetical protein